MMLNRIFSLALSVAVVLMAAGSGLPARCRGVVKSKDIKLRLIEDLMHANPNDVGLRLDRVEQLVNVRRFDEAIDECDGLIKRNPKLRDAYAAKAQALAGKNRFKEALGCIDEAFRLGAPTSKLLMAKGIYLKRDERYAEAVVILDRVIKAEPRYANAYVQRAFCYRQIYGPTEKSLRDLEMVAKLKPDDPTVKAQIKGLKNAISKQAGKARKPI